MNVRQWIVEKIDDDALLRQLKLVPRLPFGGGGAAQPEPGIADLSVGRQGSDRRFAVREESLIQDIVWSAPDPREFRIVDQALVVSAPAALICHNGSPLLASDKSRRISEPGQLSNASRNTLLTSS